MDKYKIHWFRSIPSNLEDFTEVQFKDHSQTGIPPPNPMFIVLRSAISHILNLSGASEAIDKVYDEFLDESPISLPGNSLSKEECLLRLSLMD